MRRPWTTLYAQRGGGGVERKSRVPYLSPSALRCLRLCHASANLQDVNGKDSRGFTPLQYACRAGSRQCIEQLLAANANPNLVSGRGTREDAARCCPSLVVITLGPAEPHMPSFPPYPSTPPSPLFPPADAQGPLAAHAGVPRRIGRCNQRHA